MLKKNQKNKKINLEFDYIYKLLRYYKIKESNTFV